MIFYSDIFGIIKSFNYIAYFFNLWAKIFPKIELSNYWRCFWATITLFNLNSQNGPPRGGVGGSPLAHGLFDRVTNVPLSQGEPPPPRPPWWAVLNMFLTRS